ncbi:hypothetical protein ZWY2020_018449 [Hordeum vulgare]|nr:hypothetical protein ZWY2020_018449 [Hordeum vulgare]
MLPKQRNTTLASGWPSSHARHSCRFVVPVSSSGFISGPMRYSGGVGCPGGVQRPETMAFTARGSKERQLLTRTPVSRTSFGTAQEVPVAQALAIQDGRGEVIRRDRRESRGAHGVAVHVPEAQRGALVDDRLVQTKGDAGDAGGEEEVCGDGELGADVERGAAEEVDEEGGGAGGAEEVAQVRVGGARELEDPGLEAAAGSSHFGERGRGRQWKASAGLAAARPSRNDVSPPPRRTVTRRPCARSSLPSSTVGTRWPAIPGGA